MQEVRKKPNYLELLPEREYLKNLFATLISRFGDSIDSIAFTWLVYELTGSAALTATTMGVNMLVTVLLQPFTAALITGLKKKPIMVWTAIGRGLLVAGAALLFYFGLARPWMLIAMTALISTLEAFGQPAGTAAYPKIISKDKYSLAMSLNAAASRGAELAGMALAGVFIATIGTKATLLVDACAFMLSGVILMFLHIDEACRKKTKGVMRQFLEDTEGGFRYVVRNKLILALCLSACALNFALVPFSSLQAAFVNDGLQLGTVALSVIGVCMTVGTMIGALLYPMITPHMGRFKLLFLSLLLMSVCYMALAAVPFGQNDVIKWASLVLVLIPMGTAVGLANTNVGVIFMEMTDEQYLARASGIMNSVCLAANPVASFIVAGVANLVNVTALIFGCGVFSVLVTLAFLLVKPLRKI